MIFVEEDQVLDPSCWRILRLRGQNGSAVDLFSAGQIRAGRGSRSCVFHILRLEKARLFCLTLEEALSWFPRNVSVTSDVS